ncbi:hypothetical protein SDJN02_17988, partial [Cucurbita argyrosperma subsp. argyrosperma]
MANICYALTLFLDLTFQYCVASEGHYLSQNGVSELEGISTLSRRFMLKDSQIEPLESIAEDVAGSREEPTTIYLKNNQCNKTLY